jgi:SsrA-binding protein
MAKPDGDGRKIVATNRKARHDYDIVDTYECGIVLKGSEVKSLRAGQVQLKDAYADFRGTDLWLENMHIAPYQFARGGGHDPERARKLLLHKHELQRLIGKINEAGLTLVPLSVYFTHGLAKVEMALGKGRRRYDKRQAIRAREEKREMDRAIGRARRR